jgi:hypothetical protein
MADLATCLHACLLNRALQLRIEAIAVTSDFKSSAFVYGNDHVKMLLAFKKSLHLPSMHCQ